MNETILKNVFDSLDIMWKGMLGLFVVAGIVSVITMILAKITKERRHDPNG
jgi:hypothetical protein